MFVLSCIIAMELPGLRFVKWQELPRPQPRTLLVVALVLRCILKDSLPPVSNEHRVPRDVWTGFFLDGDSLGPESPGARFRHKDGMAQWVCN